MKLLWSGKETLDGGKTWNTSYRNVKYLELLEVKPSKVLYHHHAHSRHPYPSIHHYPRLEDLCQIKIKPIYMKIYSRGSQNKYKLNSLTCSLPSSIWLILCQPILSKDETYCLSSVIYLLLLFREKKKSQPKIFLKNWKKLLAPKTSEVGIFLLQFKLAHGQQPKFEHGNYILALNS